MGDDNNNNIKNNASNNSGIVRSASDNSLAGHSRRDILRHRLYSRLNIFQSQIPARLQSSPSNSSLQLSIPSDDIDEEHDVDSYVPTITFASAPQQKLTRRHLVLKCLEFSHDGSVQNLALTRQQILDRARSNITVATPKTPHSPPEINSPFASNHYQPPKSIRMLEPRSLRGRSSNRSRPITLGGTTFIQQTQQFRQRKRVTTNALTMRDLRQVDPDFTEKPALWVRQNALVISLEGVRALVLYDRLLLFDALATEGNGVVTDLVRYLKSYLSRYNISSHAFFVPFEFRALDAILEYACYSLTKDFSAINPRIQTTLSILPKRITADVLEKLRADEMRLNAVYARASKVRHTLQEVLDEDEDMAGMYLTEKRKYPEKSSEQHDEIETLLETHLQAVDDITTKAELLNSAIDNTEDLIEIHLDTMQNRLLLLDLRITSISTILAFVSMVTSIFGMNLVFPRSMRFLPSSANYFFATVGLMVVIMVIALLGLYRWCSKLGEKVAAGNEERLFPWQLQLGIMTQPTPMAAPKSRRRLRDLASKLKRKNVTRSHDGRTQDGTRGGGPNSVSSRSSNHSNSDRNSGSDGGNDNSGKKKRWRRGKRE